MPNLPFLPRGASNFSGPVDLLFVVLTVLSALIFALVLTLIVYFGIRYRRRYPEQVGRHVTGSTRLELGGMAFLAALALTVFFWGAGIYTRMFMPPDDALTLNVVGQQWMWKIQHPTGQREINTLHLPAGRAIRLMMTSQDVIHAFYVPAFRLKADVLPGRYTTLWFTATEPGTYRLNCAEYCGTGHSMMIGDVTVMAPQDYEQWLRGAPSLAPADQGAGLFQSLGCIACHQPGSQQRAPQLAGLFGQPVRLQTGETVTADESYIRESILTPGARIVEGYQPIMPSFQGRLSEEELLRLIAYLRSLGAAPGTPGAPPPPATGQPALPPAGSQVPGPAAATPGGPVPPVPGQTSAP